MDNKKYLLSLNIRGIKNIQSDLLLEFYKKTVDKNFDPAKHRIKAIYGENGCGKTAIITAAQILKDLICDRSHLRDSMYQNFLKDVVNQQTQMLHLECEFYCYAEPLDRIYHYIIELSPGDDDRYGIDFEELTYRRADYTTSKVNTVFRSNHGITVEGMDPDEKGVHIAALKEFGSCLCTNIMIRKSPDEGDHYYESKEIKDLTRFLKTIKPELAAISYETGKGSDDSARLTLDYGQYKVRLDQEGKGVRRLIDLWPFLKAAANGSIVLIDGLDQDINEIILDRLVGFMVLYAQGQLCFTACNTSPMQLLRKNKNAIDFLAMNGKVSNWRSRGNYAPASLYKDGMIANLPFNIEAEDFLGVL